MMPGRTRGVDAPRRGRCRGWSVLRPAEHLPTRISRAMRVELRSPPPPSSDEGGSEPTSKARSTYLSAGFRAARVGLAIASETSFSKGRPSR